MDESYSLADIRAATAGGRSDGMFGGGDWGAWIILFLIFSSAPEVDQTDDRKCDTRSRQPIDFALIMLF